MNKLAVYVHLPFCRKKCYYCDFLSFSSGAELRRSYLDALIKEAELYSEITGERGVSSLYFGGGTPSLLSLDELDYLFERLFKILKPQGELSFEMNPEDVSRDKVQLLKSYGDFRISLGAQSFDDRLLNLFGRVHDAATTYRSCEVLRGCGVDNFSLDLIYAVSEEFSMEENIRAISSLMPSHISCYALELHPTRPLAKLIREPGEELYRRDWDYLKEGLGKLGFTRYEISSFTSNSSYSLHNLNYWQGGDYLGLGLGAHGFLRPFRYSNERNLKKYLEVLSNGQMPLAEKNLLTMDEERFEYFMLGLRVIDGIDLGGLKPLKPKEVQAIEKHRKLGLMELEGNRLRITDEGFNLFNYILVDFL